MGYPVDPHRSRCWLQDQGAVKALRNATVKFWRPSPTAHVDERRIRRIGWQLALVTGVTISALLLVLGLAVYESTQSALYGQMRTSVVHEAQEQALQLIGPPPSSNGYSDGVPDMDDGSHGHGPPVGPGRTPYSADSVYVSVLKPDLACRSSTPGGPAGEYGHRIPDLQVAQHVVQTDTSQFASFTYHNVRYLSYTLPVFPASRAHSLIGVVQASAAETQYQQSVRRVLNVLLLVGLLGFAAAMLITGMVVHRALLPIRSSLRRQRDFVADAAHELRTPITIIKTAGEMLLRDSNGEKREEMAQVTLEESNHLSRLVADLSLLARSDTGTLDFAHEEVDLSALVAGVAGDVEVLAEDRSIAMIRILADGVFVLGDGMRLRQLLLVLLDNALKHTPGGGTVEVRLDTVRKRARLQVIDSGSGIPSADLHRIFDRFFRSDAARSGDGTGLGLAIAQSIARAHRGDISAANRTEAAGAVLTVSIPIAGATRGTIRSAQP